MTGTTLLADDRSLEEFLERNRNSKLLAIDTEFVREKTFYPKLCLIQLATENELACVDVLGISKLSLLDPLFFNPDCLKVLHSASQDLEVLYKALGRLPAPLFDTQVAAVFCGFREQLGYGDLVEALCDVRLEKAHSRFDWTRRPLPEKVLVYAADDVRYLPPMYRKLKSRLLELERENWVLAESELLLNEMLYEQPIEEAWMRVRGLHRLDDSEWEIACALATWREKTAREEDRPRQWIIRNETILEIARLQQPGVADLKQIKEIPGRYARDIAALLADPPAAGNPRQAEPERMNDVQRKQLKKLVAETEKRATTLEIASTMLATKRDLEQLVRGNRDGPLLAGWRREIIGEPLLEILDQQ